MILYPVIAHEIYLICSIPRSLSIPIFPTPFSTRVLNFTVKGKIGVELEETEKEQRSRLK